MILPVVCIAGNAIDRTSKNGWHVRRLSLELCYTLDTSHTANGVITEYAVRRLMTVEYEQLQGFPDNFSRIPWRKKIAADCPDSPRYKVLGNSMPVPVIRWMGERIRRYHSAHF